MPPVSCPLLLPTHAPFCSSAYGASKLANVLHARELSRRMAQEGVDVAAVSLHPGVIATELMRNLKTAHWAVEAAIDVIMTYLAAPLFKTPYEGAQTTLFAATAPMQPWGTPPSKAADTDVIAGQYYADATLKVHPIIAASDTSALELQLWQYSEGVTSWQYSAGVAGASQPQTQTATAGATPAPAARKSKRKSKKASTKKHK